ncbi:hypothetical protein [Catenuloplanes indicus]|uniref:Uncharacterized protein n=1 Tax=Catenuloplanes indicus TaxID=137267 RepID=A0AAE3W208_9ACTN|nr:hypothetical protein [Catenuloplanes indicus]MDQ0367462.1 hypothetical protein [Catenuloplanes indicus]
MAVLVGATPASAASSTLSLTSISFGSTQVDASNGDVTPLTWTVTDSNTDSYGPSGTVTLRQRGDGPGEFVGLSHRITFQFGDQGHYAVARHVSGPATASTYVYDFAPPRHSATGTAEWVVTSVEVTTIGATLTVTDGLPSLTATTLVDDVAPTLQHISLTGIPDGREPYVFAGTGALRVSLSPVDYPSGISHAVVTFTGPGGQTINGEARVETIPGSGTWCGETSTSGLFQPHCTALVHVPAGAPSGVWHLTSVALTDNSGNTGVITDGLDVPSVTVTSNESLSVRAFTATPNPVNNWHGDTWTTLTLAVDGAQGGVSLVQSDFQVGSCQDVSATPTVNSDDTVSVPVRMRQGAEECIFVSLAVVDGAGNVALYGPGYQAPAIGLTIERLPNTTPPVASDLSWERQTFAASETGASLVLTMAITAPVAPVNTSGLYLVLPNGHELPLNGSHEPGDGTLTIRAGLPSGLAPGTYPVRLYIQDAGWLRSDYAAPDITVIAG